jgi:hypothetical protein
MPRCRLLSATASHYSAVRPRLWQCECFAKPLRNLLGNSDWSISMRTRTLFKELMATAFMTALVVFCQPTLAKGGDPWIDVTGEGQGVFAPAIGLFFGSGEGNLLGTRNFTGNVDVDPLDFSQLTNPLGFRNLGRGTADEQFQEIITTDGSSLSLRFEGTVQLEPLGPPEDQLFTATWVGDFEIAHGTGRYKNASGSFEVIAVNKPFQLTDPAWEFDWTWEGRAKLDRKALRKYTVLTTEGLGTFEPANLGIGDPDPSNIPFVIGDGSGLAIYDGTPTGDNHRLDGILVASGNDQHFGTAQSLTPGLLTSEGIFRYPGTEGDAGTGVVGTDIHRMVTDIGELWLKKTYAWELDLRDPSQPIFVAPVDFRVVGGTGLYRNATGSIFCLVTADFPAVNPFADPVVVPFHYDFDGYVELTPINRFILKFLQLFWRFHG